MFERIAIIGLGMIGSSLAYDIRKHKISRSVIGIDPSTDNGTFLLTKGLIQSSFSSIDEATKPVDLVIIASPPSSFAEIAAKLKSLLKSGTLIIDVGSVKQAAIDAISKHIPKDATYIPTHPIAGKAETGAVAGEEGLFDKKRIILTPHQEPDEASITKVINFWQNIGGACEIMDADKHDLIYAHISHLPQIVAYAVSQTLNELWDVQPNVAIEYALKLRLFTRIGSSSPKLWADIAMQNKEHLTTALQGFLQVISHMGAELNSGKDQEQKPISIPKAELLARLFPRLIASATISSAQLCEHKHNITVLPYVGSGFADLAAPAMEAPDGDMEKISKAYQQVATLLKTFEGHFRTMFIALENSDADALYQAMSLAQISQNKLAIKLQ